MRKLAAALTAALLLIGSALGQSRVATVNMDKVFDLYWKTKQVRAALKERAGELDRTDQQMIGSCQKAQSAYQRLCDQAGDQALPLKDRQRCRQAAKAKLEDIQNQEDNIAQFERQATASLTEERAHLRRELFADIKAAVAREAKADDYSLVIDSDSETYVAGPGGTYYLPTILDSTGKNDITENVLSRLNATAPQVFLEGQVKNQERMMPRVQ